MTETSDGGTMETSDEHAGETNEGRTNRTTQTDPTLRRVLTAHGLIAVMAALIFWSPYVFTGSGRVLLTGPALGASIVLLVAFNAYRSAEGRSFLLPVSIVVLVLAAVAAATPFLLEVESQYVFGVTTAAGVLAALLSLYTAVGGWQLKGRSAATN